MIPMFIYTYAALQELKHKQKSHICVISGDPDLASTIARLVDRDHTVVRTTHFASSASRLGIDIKCKKEKNQLRS